MTKLNYMLIVFALLVTACSDNDTASSESNQSGGTMIDPQLKALEKAKGVEQQLQDSAERQIKQIEEQESY